MTRTQLAHLVPLVVTVGQNARHSGDWTYHLAVIDARAWLL